MPKLNAKSVAETRSLICLLSVAYLQGQMLISNYCGQTSINSLVKANLYGGKLYYILLIKLALCITLTIFSLSLMLWDRIHNTLFSS